MKRLITILLLSIAFLFPATSVFAGEQVFGNLDKSIGNIIEKYGIPGGAIAVVRDGRLVYAKGYGMADKKNGVPFTPESLCRIASISKPITAVAVFKAIEESNGRLTLDTKVFPYLGIKPFLSGGDEFDPGLNQITVRNLLQHSGGWDSALSGDPMLMDVEIAVKLGVPSPPSQEDIIRYMLGRPLDFSPGEKYAYSNFGYLVLGKVIEKATGARYEDYVYEKVFKPAGISEMKPGRSLKKNRLPGEVIYYSRNTVEFPSVFDDSGNEMVEDCYGGFCVENMSAHGGWTASVIDLARFAVAMDNSALIGRDSCGEMYARPGIPQWSGSDYYYGCGWLVRPEGNGGNYWHLGALRGSASFLIRRQDGIDWALLFNQDFLDNMEIYGEVEQIVNKALSSIGNWPRMNLFPDYK